MENTNQEVIKKKEIVGVVPWFKQPEVVDNLIPIPSEKIFITHTAHKKGLATLSLNPKTVSTVAVNYVGSDTYILIAGVNSYIRAKTFNLPVNAYITDDDRETFRKRFSLPR